MSNALCRMRYVECVMSNVECRMSNALCRMGQPLRSSIIILFFLCIAAQFNHTCPTTQMRKTTPATDQGRKKHREKSLEKSGTAVVKRFK